MRMLSEWRLTPQRPFLNTLRLSNLRLNNVLTTLRATLSSAALAALLTLSSQAASAASTTTDGPWLVLGDSISAGYGIDSSQGWVALLDKRLDETLGRDAPDVINASISGDTTEGGRNRLAALLDKHHPSLVMIELGGNDGLRGLPPQRMQANLASMLETVQATGAQPVLLGIEIPPNYGPAYTKAFRQVYRTLETQYSVPLVPFILDGIATAPASQELMQQDRIHPTAKAQPQLLDIIWPTLAPLAE
ncbi:arylesterase [Cobetia sp. L2A1]|uniref:arylesterase n=1 Tax=Cobetia sp. L2A1 TaxID=2686360 RepID=UPI001E48D86F|nr:arylesterase [Cobetia sp. L2A1]